MSLSRSENARLAEELAARPYTVKVSQAKLDNGKVVFVASNPELRGLLVQGDSAEEAKKQLALVRIDYIYSMLEAGLEIPNPAPRQPTVSTSSTAVIKIYEASAGQYRVSPRDPDKDDVEELDTGTVVQRKLVSA